MSDHHVGGHDDGSNVKADCAERSRFDAKGEEFKDSPEGSGDEKCDQSDADPVFQFHSISDG